MHPHWRRELPVLVLLVVLVLVLDRVWDRFFKEEWSARGVFCQLQFGPSSAAR